MSNELILNEEALALQQQLREMVAAAHEKFVEVHPPHITKSKPEYFEFVDYHEGKHSRGDATELLTQFLNASGVCLEADPDSEYEGLRLGIPAGEFTCDFMHIFCGQPMHRYQDDISEPWEIVVWLDGQVEATAYDERIGMFDPVAEIPFRTLIEDPRLIIESLRKMIILYSEEIADLDD